MFTACSKIASGGGVRAAAGHVPENGTAAAVMRCVPVSGVNAVRRTRMPHVENHQIVETATEARGAKPGRPVLYVLLTSMAGVIVLFAVVYFVLFTTH
jgi:hypothetical protein